jgi:transcriptional regulator with XRE-family HTH domain
VSVALAEARMTQTDLAAKTGRSTAYVNQLITGHKKPSPEWVDLIADTLNLSPRDRQGAACRRRQATRLQARPDQEMSRRAGLPRGATGLEST